MFKNLHAIVFDFDGVLTDNFVYVNQEGEETVRCSRSDGLGFDALRRTKVKLFILSTETNKVVTARSKKIKIPVFQGISNKEQSLKELAERENIDLKFVLYVGNDMNDYKAMMSCGYSACPSDSHPNILKIARFVLNTRGGCGVVRELVEETLKLNRYDFLNSGNRDQS